MPDGQQKTSGGTSRLSDLFQKAVFRFVGPRTGKQVAREVFIVGFPLFPSREELSYGELSVIVLWI